MIEIEQTGVLDVYLSIAKHFSDKRRNQWSWITEFIIKINENKGNISVLDIGCGNGRNMEGFNKNVNVFGIDNCNAFVKICRERGKNVTETDMAEIPFGDNYFDYLISIASFHHLSTKTRRIKALREIHRVSKPNAKMLLSVWSLNQPPNSGQSKKIKNYGDNLITWNKYNENFQRYYYIFQIVELKQLLTENGWEIERHFWDYGNEVVILKCIK